MEKCCRFCDIVQGNYYYGEIDIPIYENEDYIVVASVGAFIEGWTLIISKAHHLSMRQDYLKQSFINAYSRIGEMLQKEYGPILFFEHAPIQKSSITSCGTAHAHIHLVPFQGTVKSLIEISNLKWVACNTSDINTLAEGNEYLFCAMPDGALRDSIAGFLSILKQPTSQFFRKAIAYYLGKDINTDYREEPFLQVAHKTRSTLLRYGS